MIRTPREIADEIATIIKTQLPLLAIEYPSNVHFMCNELAMDLAGVYSELYHLMVKYNIKQEDAQPLSHHLMAITRLPSKVVMKTMEVKE